MSCFKDIFHQYVDEVKETIFNDLSKHIIERLDSAADVTKQVMDGALDALANKTEVSMSVLWEIPKDSEEQHQLRRELVSKVQILSGLVQMWQKAATLRDGDCDAKSN